MEIITFLVKLVDRQKIYSSSQPDSLQNIIFGLQNATIQIPGVNRILKDGDKFVLYDSHALEIKKVYATGDYPVLQVIDGTITVSTTTLLPASPGITYSQQISATGGFGALTFSATGLPTGLSINTSGLISGVTNIAGSYNIIVTVLDSIGDTSSSYYTLTVTAPALSILDTFTDTNGVFVQNHVMDLGTGWNVLQGSGVIQNNKLQSNTSGTSLRMITPSLHSDGAISVDVTLPASGNVSAGLLLRSTDKDTGWGVVLENDGSGLTVSLVKFGGVI